MKCTNCGATIPEHARFCAGCGRALNSASTALASGPTPQTQGASKAKWWAIGVGVLLLMAVAFVVGMRSGLITRANVQKPEAPSVLEAQAPKVDAPSVLEAQPPKVDAPSVLETEAPKPPPKHVMDWLEHLRKTEERRQRIERNIAPVMSMLVQATLARALRWAAWRKATWIRQKPTTSANARNCAMATSNANRNGRNCCNTSAACPRRQSAKRSPTPTSQA
jgi:hypothetical protein